MLELVQQEVMGIFHTYPPSPLSSGAAKRIEAIAAGADEILIRVHAATVTAGDVILRKLRPLLFLPMRLFGVRRKKIPGHEFAGEIESEGKNVKYLERPPD
ncbi:MAG: alcohol dehydrogenase catalytic domain-containing protein [Anaerolineales bacterium]|nr:alcohol dehydrogenase catalytic domain-containing protein [Anaerolineales bacterium]